MSIQGKTFTFASKQCPQVPKHFEICGKAFAVQVKTVKCVKVLGLKSFVLHSIATLGDLKFGWVKLILVNDIRFAKFTQDFPQQNFALYSS